MEFILGIIVGLLIDLVIITTLTFFKTKVERMTSIIQTKISDAGPNQKGGIFLPDDEATASRKEIIKRNKKAGKDTYFSELQ